MAPPYALAVTAPHAMLSCRFRAGLFTVGGLGCFAGAYDPSSPRGAPYFCRPVAEDIAAAYRALPTEYDEPPRAAEYVEATDTFRFLDAVSVEWMEWAGVEVEGVHRYPIGSPQWTWSLVDDDTGRSGPDGCRFSSVYM